MADQPSVSPPEQFNAGFDPGSNGPLKNFLRQLLHNAINAGVHSLFWRLPTTWIVIIIVVLIGAVLWFGLY